MAKEFKISSARLKELEDELKYLKTTRGKGSGRADQGGPLLWRPLGEQRI